MNFSFSVDNRTSGLLTSAIVDVKLRQTDEYTSALFVYKKVHVFLMFYVCLSVCERCNFLAHSKGLARIKFCFFIIALCFLFAFVFFHYIRKSIVKTLNWIAGCGVCGENDMISVFVFFSI